MKAPSRRLFVSAACLCAVAVMALCALLLGLRASRACSITVSCSPFDLKLRDQDEGWKDGVSGTWCATDMKPGDEYPFKSSFVQLKQLGLVVPDHVEIGMDYALRQGGGTVSVSADEMARQLIITRLEYYNRDWKINLLTGAASGNPPRPPGYSSGDWSVRDVDGDGRITFYDLKADPLDDLPPPCFWMSESCLPYMAMSVKFAEEAGNRFMGLDFDVSLAYTLNQNKCQ